MGFFERWAKKRGYVKKESSRLAAKRSFNAAQTGRLISSWTTQPKPIDSDIRDGLRKLRARTREQALNNDYVRRFLQLLKSNVVGPTGVTLQARTLNSRGEPDNLDNQAIEEGWAEWGRKGTPDVTGQFSWTQVQGLFLNTIAKDGEALLVMHSRRGLNKFRFSVELLDPEVLDVELNHELPNGNKIQMGVELNTWRRPVAYWLLTASKTDYDYLMQGRKYRRIPASRVIHGYLPESVWQTRGFPWLAASLMRLNMLQGYEEAELVAARVGSAKMGFFETEGGEEYLGDDQDENDVPIMEADPGTFTQLPAGVKLSDWSPYHPSTAFSEFVKANLRGVASGFGVSYFTLANDLTGVNYNSGRLGSLEDREIYKGLQEWLIETLHWPIYNAWLENALLSGALVNPAGVPLPADRVDKFSRITWQPRRWQWMDPKKDMDAHLGALAAKLRSPQKIIMDMGDDPDQVLEDWEDWEKKLADKGLVMSVNNQSGGNNNAQENDDETD